MLRILALGTAVLGLTLFGVLAQGDSATSDPYAETGWTNAFDTGEALYGAMCASCHGIAGEGDFGLALAGNPTVASDSYVVMRIVQGGGGMPRLGPPQLSAEHVRLVVNHVRSSWGNDYVEVDLDTILDHIAVHAGNVD